MADTSSFKAGNANQATRTVLTPAMATEGKPRDAREGMSPAQLYPLNENPVRETPSVSKNLRNVGG